MHMRTMKSVTELRSRLLTSTSDAPWRASCCCRAAEMSEPTATRQNALMHTHMQCEPQPNLHSWHGPKTPAEAAAKCVRMHCRRVQ